MADLFLFLLLISFVCLIVGLIKPSIFNRVLGKGATRKKAGLVFGLAMIVCFILVGLTAEPTKRDEEIILQETVPKTLTPSQEELEDEILTEDTLPVEEETIKEDFQPEQEIQDSSTQGQIKDEPITQEPIPQSTQEPTAEESKVEESSMGGKWYTSSYYTAKYYYHESCQGWQGLSPTYLKTFNNEAELLSKYNRILHPDCKPK